MHGVNIKFEAHEGICWTDWNKDR